MAGVQNMTAGTLYVLQTLLDADGTKLTPTQVMDKSKVLPHTAQRVLLRLVDDGHARREVFNGNRTRYWLTAEGALWARETVHDYVALTSSQRKRRRLSARGGV